jgi:hypothetical protein
VNQVIASYLEENSTIQAAIFISQDPDLATQSTRGITTTSAPKPRFSCTRTECYLYHQFGLTITFR